MFLFLPLCDNLEKKRLIDNDTHPLAVLMTVTVREWRFKHFGKKKKKFNKVKVSNEVTDDIITPELLQTYQEPLI